jgi:adenosine/AMP kinase
MVLLGVIYTFQASSVGDIPLKNPNPVIESDGNFNQPHPPEAVKERIPMNLTTVDIQKPAEINFILGQSHFIKTIEDLHEALVTAVPGIKFGAAFCEASGKRLVRWSGTDAEMTELARQNALAVGAGHSFIIFLGAGFYPINVLNAVKAVAEVCRIFCASANPVQVILAETEQGRGILGVVDGAAPLGIEGEEDIAWRKGFLRTIGYKL